MLAHTKITDDNQRSSRYIRIISTSNKYISPIIRKEKICQLFSQHTPRSLRLTNAIRHILESSAQAIYKPSNLQRENLSQGTPSWRPLIYLKRNVT